MRAIAVIPSAKRAGIIEQPEPRISSPTEVKLRMSEAGFVDLFHCTAHWHVVGGRDISSH